LNVLSLFDGISTGYLALQRAGIKFDNYFSSEIAPDPIKISEKHFPDIIRLGDVTKVHASELPKIDLLIGGSPCQGFSRAGKCLNLDDPRSKLVFEYVRILEEIYRINPDVKFLLENVKMKHEWARVISDELGIEPIEVNSKLLSAQNRLRMYWTNIPVLPFDITDPPLSSILEDVDTNGFIEKDGILFDPTISEASRNLVSVVNGEIRIKQSTILGYIVPEDYDGINLDFPTSQSRRGRVIRRKSPTLTSVQNTTGVYYRGIFRPYTITEMERLQTLPDGYTEGVSLSARKEAIGNGWTTDVIAHFFRGLRV
jgi:DNA (cytosine-5)-methyltransferase 3A